MLKREIYIKNIADGLAVFSKSIEFRGKIQLNDLNKIAETFVAELLNIKNGWQLKNLNSNNGNFPAIDLGDNSNRICIQVTSDKSKGKISHTLDLADKHQHYLNFDQFIIFILGTKQKSYSKLTVPTSIIFDSKKDIWDWTDIIKTLDHYPTNRLQEIESFLLQEVRNFASTSGFTDSESLKTIRHILNSGMLKDNFALEGSMTDFYETLNKHIKLLTTGKRDSKIVCKGYNEFEDPQLKIILESVHERFLALRSLYIASVQKGDIKLDSGFNYFKSKRIPNLFNELRKDIVDDLNILFKNMGETELKLNY